MNKTLLIVGIGGTIGKSLLDFYDENKNFTVYGTSTKKDNLKENIFHLDFLKSETIHNLPEFKIDHLIIASGYKPKFNLDQMTESHLKKMFDIHLTGPMLLIKKIKEQLSNNSSVTLISSPAAWQGSYDPAYSAVKGGTNSFIRTMAKDLAPTTRVNAVSPSLIEGSTVFRGMSEDFKKIHLEKTLNKKMLTVDQCVHAIDFILNHQHFTGQILHINGGMIYG